MTSAGAYAVRSPFFLTNEPLGISFLRDAPPEERKSRLEFHIASGDYFGTLATIMGLMADMLMTDDIVTHKNCAQHLTELRDDLAYLQETHAIERKR